jgi:hypothetical protein
MSKNNGGIWTKIMESIGENNEGVWVKIMEKYKRK